MTLIVAFAALAAVGTSPVDQAPASTKPDQPCPIAVSSTGTAPSPAAPAGAGVAAADPNEIVVTGDLRAPKEDPLRAVNAKSFVLVSKVDDAVVGPVAMAYKHALPGPARDGLHNALSNLTEPVVFVNDMLQLHPVRAGKTLLRFAINSTIGLGGLFDIARKKPFHLEHHNNGLADTLGYYGVGAGPYLYLPLIGPTTVRDLFGRVIDLSLLPTAVGPPFSRPYFSLPLSVLKSLDDRVTFDARQRYLREATADPYGSERNYYLQLRANEIAGLHGRHPELSERFGSPPPPGTPLLTTPCPNTAEQKP